MANSGEAFQTPRSSVRRKRERARYDRAAINSILDEALVCHVGFIDGAHPVVLPMAYGRRGDVLYLHGAAGNAMLRALGTGDDVCVTVTLVDGVVLARSQFHHSINYRSVVLFGAASLVDDVTEKQKALATIVEHIVPGRTSDARPPTTEELRATVVVRFPIAEGSAKVRTGGPVEEPADLDLPIWGGHIPFETIAGPPVDDHHCHPTVPVPIYARGYQRPRAHE